MSWHDHTHINKYTNNVTTKQDMESWRFAENPKTLNCHLVLYLCLQGRFFYLYFQTQSQSSAPDNHLPSSSESSPPLSFSKCFVLPGLKTWAKWIGPALKHCSIFFSNIYLWFCTCYGESTVRKLPSTQGSDHHSHFLTSQPGLVTHLRQQCSHQAGRLPCRPLRTQ